MAVTESAKDAQKRRCPHGTRATPAHGTSRQTTHVSSVSSSVDDALEYCSIEHLGAAKLGVVTEMGNTFLRGVTERLRVTYITGPAFPVLRFGGVIINLANFDILANNSRDH